MTRAAAEKRMPPVAGGRAGAHGRRVACAVAERVRGPAEGWWPRSRGGASRAERSSAAKVLRRSGALPRGARQAAGLLDTCCAPLSTSIAPPSSRRPCSRSRPAPQRRGVRPTRALAMANGRAATVTARPAGCFCGLSSTNGCTMRSWATRVRAPARPPARPPARMRPGCSSPPARLLAHGHWLRRRAELVRILDSLSIKR
jgi:hypothetical protein